MSQIDQVLETMVMTKIQNKSASEPFSTSMNLKNVDRFGVPKRYFDAGFGDFPTAFTRELGDIDHEEGYFLTGPSGVGKTHLAVAIMRHWIASGRADRWQDNGTWMPIKRTMAMFVSVPELLDSVRAEFAGGNSIEAVLKYARQQVLVIDDLGAEKTSDWTFTTIYSVISKRVNYILPTIVTSNMSIEQIRQWEPRIASRLSGLKVIIMQGKDKRIKA